MDDAKKIRNPLEIFERVTMLLSKIFFGKKEGRVLRKRDLG